MTKKNAHIIANQYISHSTWNLKHKYVYVNILKGNRRKLVHFCRQTVGEG